jgi:hypothetical protein
MIENYIDTLHFQVDNNSLAITEFTLTMYRIECDVMFTLSYDDIANYNCAYNTLTIKYDKEKVNEINSAIAIFIDKITESFDDYKSINTSYTTPIFVNVGEFFADLFDDDEIVVIDNYRIVQQ